MLADCSYPTKLQVPQVDREVRNTLKGAEERTVPLGCGFVCRSQTNPFGGSSSSQVVMTGTATHTL
jgi:hypothetical protein